MRPEIKKILYATDLSPNSAYVLRLALNAARLYKAEIIIPLPKEELDITFQDK